MRDFDLRKLQLLEFEMLKDVAKFCDDNKIEYFLSSGTLIGAARHKGFIPWDDDIDIYMDLKNYRKFNRLANKGFYEKYFVQNFCTERKILFPWTKIRVNGTTSMERHRCNYDIHYGVCMDIFLLNGISNNKYRRKIQEKSARIQRELLQKYSYLECGFEIHSRKERIMYEVLPEWLRMVLIKLLDRLICIDISKCSECYGNFNYKINKCPHFSTEWFSEFDKMEFEGEMFKVPKMYDEYLTKLYGDWRTPPPVNERVDHGDIIVDLHNDYSNYWGEELRKKKNKNN